MGHSIGAIGAFIFFYVLLTLLHPTASDIEVTQTAGVGVIVIAVLFILNIVDREG